MHRRILHRTLVWLALAALAIGTFTVQAQTAAKRGRKYKSPPPTARIEVDVLRDSDGKPLENASIIFHPMEGERDKGNMELKSNGDGKALIDVLPIGDTVRLQVIAKGYQTHGQDFKVDKAEMALEIRMKRPGEQYSIYKQHDQAAGDENNSAKPDQPADKDKQADEKKPDDKPASPKSN